jgi:hypothetical protein
MFKNKNTFILLTLYLPYPPLPLEKLVQRQTSHL